MDAKYLAEIKAREQAATRGPWEMSNEPKGSGFFGTIHGKAGVSFSGNRADNEFIAHARTDIPALLAEVERLTKEIETGRHMNAPINLDAASAESFCNAIDVSRLEQENFAKDRQIATLKRALELGAEHIVSLTTNSDCHMKENSEFCMDTISCVDCIQKRFIQQAQEQEAKK